MMLFAWAFSVASAAPVGHYHPLDVSAASQRFAEAQTVAGEAFQQRQGAARSLAAGLIAYETGLDLLGDRAPADQRDRLAALERTYRIEQRTIGAFAQRQLDAFDAAFSAALERALAGREVTVCKAPRQGLRMGPRVGGAPEKACEGPSLNAELAATMDADPQLAADMKAMLTATWPNFTIDTTPQAPTSGTVWVAVYGLMAKGASEALQAIDDADDEAREDFQAAIEQGASAEAKRALVAKAEAITARTASQRAALAAPVIAAFEKVAAKHTKKSGDALGWCAQPEIFGACTGESWWETEAADKTFDHNKVVQALVEANRQRP